MGGNALKTVKVRRVDATEYFSLYGEIKSKLVPVSQYCELVKAYESKETFGDMDIVVALNYNSNPVKVVEEVFAPSEIVKNGPVLSFDYKLVQIDLLLQPSADVSNFAVSYFNFNDLGNFIGRTAHRLGFKFGSAGLKYVIRSEYNETQVVEEVIVTTDFTKALEYLDYDPDRYAQGFVNKEDIFDYVATSKYFEPAQYLLENRPSKARSRDKIRPMYLAILEYFKIKFQLEEGTAKKFVDRKQMLDLAFEQFPDFKMRYDAAIARNARELQIKTKLNGDNISIWFNLNGVELGAAMQKLNAHFKETRDSIADLTVEEFRDICETVI